MRATAAALLVLVASSLAASDCHAESDRETYGKTITIVGPTAERELIRAHLDSLAKLPTGAKLLAAIEAAATDGKDVTIHYRFGLAGAGTSSVKDASPRKWTKDADGVVTIVEPGRGASAKVYYDLNRALGEE